MIATAEVPMTKHTEHRILCPFCQRNNNFEYVVKQEKDKYYLGEKCPLCEHYEDFHEVTAREAKRYQVIDDLL